MKTITMYELLGLAKDGKAPMKVKYGDTIFTLENMDYGKEYQCKDDNIIIVLDIDINCLNEEVEIIEEEKKIPETLIPTSLKGIDNLDEKIAIAHSDTISVIDTVNEIIDYLQYLKSKGDE